MKRVLVTGAANIGKAGVATIVYKWGQEFDSEKLVYDYLMQTGMPERRYTEAIKNKGGRIYSPRRPLKGIIKKLRWINHILRDNYYDTIHINTDTAYIAALYVYIAKRNHVKNIFVHSHCTQVDDSDSMMRTLRTLAHYLARPYICKNTKLYLACSEMAGKWMFGEKRVHSRKYKTIYNGVEVEKYIFNADIRKRYRNNLNLDKKYVVGNIGRFSFQKNHDFLIDVFYEVLKIKSESVLLLVGEGEFRDQIQEKVRRLGISEKVVFLGLRNDVPSILQAMDVMVMTSRFEGLPVTMVEAQMADLPCVVSYSITKEAKYIDNVQYVRENDPAVWAKKVIRYEGIKRGEHFEKKEKSCFNICNAAQELSHILTCGRNG